VQIHVPPDADYGDTEDFKVEYRPLDDVNLEDSSERALHQVTLPQWNADNNGGCCGLDDADSGTSLSSQNISQILISGYAKSQVHSITGYIDLEYPQNMSLPAKECYRITEVENQGLWMFATQKIQAGDLIFSERPFLVAPSNFAAAGCGSSEQEEEVVKNFEKELRKTFERLDDARKEEFEQLFNYYQVDGPLLGIFRTNAIPVGIRDKGMHFLFLFIGQRTNLLAFP
jgi:hypothetical protein